MDASDPGRVTYRKPTGDQFAISHSRTLLLTPPPQPWDIMLGSTRIYLLGICTGVGMTLTLLAAAARLGFLASDALLDLGCPVSGVLLLLASIALWLRGRSTIL